MMKTRILDVGCGIEQKLKVPPDGELVRLDANPDIPADFHCDIREPLPFGEEFDIVVASHVLEHIEHDRVPKTLINLRNVLREDGELHIIVPALEWAASEILSPKTSIAVMGLIYGAQFTPYEFHKCGFTLMWLRDLVSITGMIPRKATQSQFVVVAGGQQYPAIQNVVIAMRHKAFEKEANDRLDPDPAEALA